MPKVKIPEYWTGKDVENILNSYLASTRVQDALVCPTLSLANNVDELAANLMEGLNPPNKKIYLIPVVNEDNHFSALIISKEKSECIYNDSSERQIPLQLAISLEIVTDMSLWDLCHKQQDNDPKHDNEQSAIATINNCFNYATKRENSAIGPVSLWQVPNVMEGSLNIYRKLELKPREALDYELEASYGPANKQYASNSWEEYDEDPFSFASKSKGKKNQSSKDNWYPERVEGTLRDYLKHHKKDKGAIVHNTLDIAYSGSGELWEKLPKMGERSHIDFIPIVNNDHYSAVIIERKGDVAKCYYNDSLGEPIPKKLKEALENKYGEVEDLKKEQQDNNHEHDNKHSAIATINNCFNYINGDGENAIGSLQSWQVPDVMEGSLKIYEKFVPKKPYPRREEDFMESNKSTSDYSRWGDSYSGGEGSTGYRRTTDYGITPPPYTPYPGKEEYSGSRNADRSLPPSYSSSEKRDYLGSSGEILYNRQPSVFPGTDTKQISGYWTDQVDSKRTASPSSQGQNIPDLINQLYQYTDEDIANILGAYLQRKTDTYLSPAIIVTPRGNIEADYSNSRDYLDAAINEALSGSNVLIPLHLDGGHWVAVNMKLDDQDRKKINIHYVNPFGVKIEDPLEDEFRQRCSSRGYTAAIRCDHNRRQDWAAVDCGPITVDNLMSFAEGKYDDHALNRKVSANVLRKEQQQILRSNVAKTATGRNSPVSGRSSGGRY